MHFFIFDFLKCLLDLITSRMRINHVTSVMFYCVCPSVHKGGGVQAWTLFGSTAQGKQSIFEWPRFIIFLHFGQLFNALIQSTF